MKSLSNFQYMTYDAMVNGCLVYFFLFFKFTRLYHSCHFLSTFILLTGCKENLLNGVRLSIFVLNLNLWIVNSKYSCVNFKLLWTFDLVVLFGNSFKHEKKFSKPYSLWTFLIDCSQGSQMICSLKLMEYVTNA